MILKTVRRQEMMIKERNSQNNAFEERGKCLTEEREIGLERLSLNSLSLDVTEFGERAMREGQHAVSLLRVFRENFLKVGRYRAGIGQRNNHLWRTLE